MPTHHLIDIVKLHEFLSDPKHTQKDAAQHFGVSVRSIERALHRVSGRVARRVVDEGHKIVESNLNMAARFGRFVDRLERDIKEIEQSIAELAKTDPAGAKQAKVRAQETLLKMYAEGRQQTYLALKIQQTVDVSAQMAAFQQVVIDFAGRLDEVLCSHCGKPIDAELKGLFIKMLRNANALRAGVTFEA